MARPRTTKRTARRQPAAPTRQRKPRCQPRRKRSPWRRRMAPELKRLIFIVLSAMLVMTLLLYPFERRVVPAWSVQVVDENNHPVAGIDVQQEWGQFGPHEMTWEESRVTGIDGRVAFPERVRQTPFGPAAMKYFLTSGLQPLDGQERQVPFSHLFVCRQGKTGEITWERDQGQPEERLVLHKGFCQYSSHDGSHGT